MIGLRIDSQYSQAKFWGKTTVYYTRKNSKTENKSRWHTSCAIKALDKEFVTSIKKSLFSVIKILSSDSITLYSRENVSPTVPPHWRRWSVSKRPHPSSPKHTHTHTKHPFCGRQPQGIRYENAKPQLYHNVKKFMVYHFFMKCQWETMLYSKIMVP